MLEVNLFKIFENFSLETNVSKSGDDTLSKFLTRHAALK